MGALLDHIRATLLVITLGSSLFRHSQHEQHEFLVSHSTVATMSAAFRRVVAVAALAVTSVAETQQFATVPLLGGSLDNSLDPILTLSESKR